jgi:hypothetical protein
MFKPILLFAIVLLMASGRGAVAQQCPPNSHVDRVIQDGNTQTIHCKCDDGYENRGGKCERVVQIRPTPPTIIRAQTRAECVRSAGVKLREELAKCRSPLIECMKNAGVRPKEAICAASALVVAVDPTKVTVLGAAIACGDKVYEAADVCSPTWGNCYDGPLAAHKAAITNCPSQ